MSVSMAGQTFEFKCRKCDRVKRASFVVPWAVKRSEAAKKTGFKVTRWGAQCVPSCEEMRRI